MIARRGVNRRPVSGNRQGATARHKGDFPVRFPNMRLAYICASRSHCLRFPPSFCPPTPSATSRSRKAPGSSPRNSRYRRASGRSPATSRSRRASTRSRPPSRKTAKSCERRLSVVGDALFDFDKSDLRPDAEETLVAAVPEIEQARRHGRTASRAIPIRWHRRLQPEALRSARADRARLARRPQRDPGRDADPRLWPVDAGGAEHKADGKDDPEGRQKNRRVEVVFEGCA